MVDGSAMRSSAVVIAKPIKAAAKQRAGQSSSGEMVPQSPPHPKKRRAPEDLHVQQMLWMLSIAVTSKKSCK